MSGRISRSNASCVSVAAASRCTPTDSERSSPTSLVIPPWSTIERRTFLSSTIQLRASAVSICVCVSVASSRPSSAGTPPSETMRARMCWSAASCRSPSAASRCTLALPVVSSSIIAGTAPCAAMSVRMCSSPASHESAAAARRCTVALGDLRHETSTGTELSGTAAAAPAWSRSMATSSPTDSRGGGRGVERLCVSHSSAWSGSAAWSDGGTP
mmetsp:Transcript_34430/g.85860  ORF Transcript_34430/g.85860 Transcript_34430/m.85860 type:complete len:214 (-) Transcript_34430:99-740(-)